MARGRKPLPTNLHVLRGNPSKKSKEELDTNEPKPKPIPPSCPAWLKSEAKRMWKKHAPELERLGVLTMVDGEAFAAACQNWAVYVECEKFFKSVDRVESERLSELSGRKVTVVNGRTYAYTNKAGATNLLPRPEVAIGQRALADARAFFAEFGIMPASRVRMGHKPDSEEEDAMENVLRRKRGG